MSKLVSSISVMKIFISMILLTIGVYSIISLLVIKGMILSMITMHVDIAIAFIVGSIAMIMENRFKQVMWWGIVIGFGILFVFHKEPPSLITGLCAILWGIGMVERKERACGLAILILCIIAWIGYFIDVPEMYGDILLTSTAMGPVVILLFVVISLYMIKLSKQ